MPDTALTNQLPPRTATTTTSTRGSRKWATLGGRETSSVSTTIIPTNDSETNENTSKTNGHNRHSTSLFRKSSTVSRTNDTPITSEEINPSSLKKSRSLMNVLRSKLNSPAVLRRFRSKSRESTKQTVTEIPTHTTTITTDDQEQEIKQSNTEQTTRKSRKRDPSPMRRLANRITQLTRHHKTTSPERQKKSPSKSITNDSHDQTRQSPSPLHNKDQVEHINACYDEIRAKYFNTNKRNTSTNDAQNRPLTTTSMDGSLLSNEFLNKGSLLPTFDDPLLQARKQANIKLNCILNGYNLTTSFANHEKAFGQHDLFKFNHYYDVGKRRYDYNFTNNNNRIFSSMKTRPMSKSIDSFRRTNNNENEVPVKLDKINIVDNESSVQRENHEDVPRILSDDNELVIREDNDLIKSEQSTNIQETSTLSEENKIHSTTEEQDEEFERNFLRAVDRALGVVNKNENDLIKTNEDTTSTKTDEAHLNLFQMTEQAISSLTNSALFTDDEQMNEQTENKGELEHSEVVGHIDEPLKNEEKPTDENLLNISIEKPTEENLSKVEIEKPTGEELSNVIVEKSTDEELPTVIVEQPTGQDSSKVDVEKPADEDLSKVDIEKSIDQVSSKVDIEKPVHEELATVDVEKSIDQVSSKVDIEKPAHKELPTVDIEKSIDQVSSKVDIEKPTDEELSKVDIEKSTEENLSKVEIKKPADEELPIIIVEQPTGEDSSKADIEKLADKELPTVIVEQPTGEDSSKADVEKPADKELPTVIVEQPTGEDSSEADVEKPVHEELPTVIVEQPTGQDSSKVDVEKPAVEDLSKVDIEKSIDQVSSKIDIEKPADEELPTVDIETPTDEKLSKVDIENSTEENLSKVEIEKPADEELPTVIVEQPTGEDSFKADIEKPADEELAKVDIEKSTDQDSSKVDIEKPVDEELSTIDVEKAADVDLSNVTFEELLGQDSFKVDVEKSADENLSKVDVEKSPDEESTKIEIEKPTDEELSNVKIGKATNDGSIDEDIWSVVDELIEKVDESLFENVKNGQTFLAKLDAEEKIIKNRADSFNKILQTDDNRLTEDVRTDINAVIAEVNLLLRGKLKQFRGLCEANVTKTTSGEPIPLDSDLEGFWDITYPLIDKVKEKFAKLDARKAKQWAPIEEYDPHDVNNRPRVIDDRLKQLQPQQNKNSKIPITKSANDDLKKLIQERRKAAAHTTNQNHDVEIFVAPK